MGVDGIGRVSAEELRQAVNAAMLESVTGGSNLKDDGNVYLMQPAEISSEHEDSDMGKAADGFSQVTHVGDAKRKARPPNDDVQARVLPALASVGPDEEFPKSGPEALDHIRAVVSARVPDVAAAGESGVPTSVVEESRGLTADTSAHKFEIGERVAYWSGTHNQWMEATVTRQYTDSAGKVGTYDLDVKRGAQASKIRRLSQTGELPSAQEPTMDDPEGAADGHEHSSKKPAETNVETNGSTGAPAQSSTAKEVDVQGRFKVGEQIEYWSDTYKQWMPAVVESIRKDGVIYDLDVKRGARDRKMRSVTAKADDATPTAAAAPVTNHVPGQAGPPRNTALSRGPSPLAGVVRGGQSEIAGYPAGDESSWPRGPSPLSRVGHSARRGQSPVTVHNRGSRAESVPAVPAGDSVLMGRPVLDQAYKRAPSPVSGRRRASSIERPPEIGAPAVVQPEAPSRGEVLQPIRAPQPQGNPGVLTKVAESTASTNVIASPQAQSRVTVLPNARGSSDLQVPSGSSVQQAPGGSAVQHTASVSGSSSIQHAANVSVGVAGSTLTGKTTAENAASQTPAANLSLPIAAAGGVAGAPMAKAQVMMVWDGEKVVMRQLTGGEKSPANVSAPKQKVFISCPQAGESPTAAPARPGAVVVNSAAKGVGEESVAALPGQSVYVNGCGQSVVSSYAVRVRSRSTTREYAAATAGAQVAGAQVPCVPSVHAGGATAGIKQPSLLQVEEIDIADGPFNPNDPAVHAQLMSKIGFDRSAVIEEMQGFRGGLNEGVWFLTDAARSIRSPEAPKLDLVFKLVRGNRSHERVPTEAECFVKMSQDYPGISEDPNVTFPIKIFSCMKPGKVKAYDLIVMNRAPGARLTEIVAEKRMKKEDSALLPIFTSLGSILAEFHMKYNNTQHGDFQPSNVVFDESSGKISLIDIAGMALTAFENDLDHFKKALNILKGNYTGEILDTCLQHFQAGYKTATSRC